MKTDRYLTVGVLIVLLLLAPLILADTDTSTRCSNEVACKAVCVIDYHKAETDCYCNPATATCFVRGEAALPSSNTQPSSTSPNTSPPPAQSSNASSVSSPSAVPLNQQVEFVNLQQRIGYIETQSSTVQERLAVIENAVNALQNQVNQVGTAFQALQGDVQTLQTQQQQSRTELDTRIQGVSTGLAGLQQNLESTKTQLSTVKEDLAENKKLTTITSMLFYTLLVVASGLLAYYYIQRKKMSSGELSPDALKYITTQIKQGKKYAQIRDYLKTAGWSEEDIGLAYKETMKRNYQQYLNSSAQAKTVSSGVSASSSSSASSGLRRPSQSNPDAKRMAVIAGVGILLLVGIFLVLKGVSTGQAVHFTNDRQLDEAILDLLKHYMIPNKELLPLLTYANICIEVKDEDKAQSIRFVKTPTEYSLDPLDGSCGDDASYDIALKFTNWNAFNSAARRMTCDAFRGVKNIRSDSGEPGAYVLPSRLVQSGFRLQPGADASRFCPVLKACLTTEELAKAGIGC